MLCVMRVWSRPRGLRSVPVGYLVSSVQDLTEGDNAHGIGHRDRQDGTNEPDLWIFERMGFHNKSKKFTLVRCISVVQAMQSSGTLFSLAGVARAKGAAANDRASRRPERCKRVDRGDPPAWCALLMVSKKVMSN